MVKNYLQLIKPSLTIMVVFSSIISYLLAPHIVENNWLMICLLFVAGMCVAGSANAINQVVEKDTDARMKRTAKRPVASGKISETNGWIFAIILGTIGIIILGIYFNWVSAAWAGFSLFLYAFIYTPLKKKNSMAVLVGAIPGALPCLIGWAAGDDSLSLNGWILFALQFLWQFPHFWAIAWLAHKDYSEVGFKLLPSEKGPTKFTAVQTIIYSMLLLPVSVLPFYTGLCSFDDVKGVVALGIIILANVFMIGRSVALYKTMQVGEARKVMFGSYIYLPVVLLAYLLSKASIQ